MNTPDMEYARNKLNKTYLRLAYGKSDIQKTKKEVDDILNEIITSRDTYWKETINKELLSCVTAEGGDCYFLRVAKDSPLLDNLK